MILAAFTALSFFLLFIGRMASLSSSITEVLFKEKLKGDLNSIHKYIYEYYGSINSNADSLYDARWNSIGNDYTFIDRLKSELNVEATIFIKQGLDFIRMTTTIVDPDGERAVGTTLGSSSEAYEYVSSGKSYIGKAHILGTEYLTGYQPIFASGNEIIGLVFIGVSLKEAQQHTAVIFRQAILWTGVTLVICIFIYSLFLLGIVLKLHGQHRK